MKKTILLFSILITLIAVLGALAKDAIHPNNAWIQWTLPLVALSFYILGQQLQKSNGVTASVNELNQKALTRVDLSKREYEVLCEVAKGYSNKEIAMRLFVSESTIKTHVSSILVKLDAKRRTQAVQISRTMGLVN